MKVYIGYIGEKAWDQYESDFEQAEKAFLKEDLAEAWVRGYNAETDNYDYRFYKTMDIDE